MKNFYADLNILLQAIRKASIRIIKDFYEIERLQISKKGVADFVTTADLNAERVIISHLQKSRPKYSVITEESGSLQQTHNDQLNAIEYKWVIDPIDGTFNFMHGIPFFCISVALIKIQDGESTALLGAICNPISKEIFWAGKQVGAFLIDSLGIQKKIRISHHICYEKILCTTCDNKNINSKIRKYLNFIQSKHSKIRIFGSSALEMAYLADGRINLLIQGKLNVWDYAAGTLIIQEAGGIIRDLDKNNFNLNIQGGMIAGNHRLVNNVENNS